MVIKAIKGIQDYFRGPGGPKDIKESYEKDWEERGLRKGKGKYAPKKELEGLVKNKNIKEVTEILVDLVGSTGSNLIQKQRGMKSLFKNYFDQRKFASYCYNTAKDIVDAPDKGKEKLDLIFKEYGKLLNEFKSGGFFDAYGQEVILRKNLEKKASKKGLPEKSISGLMEWLDNRRAGKISKREDYLSKISDAALAISEITDAYDGKIPDSYKDISEFLNEMGFGYSMARVLHGYGQISDRKYSSMTKKMQKGMKTEVGNLEKVIERIAASILMIFGLSLLLIPSITGSVISIELAKNKVITSFAGVSLVIIGFVLGFKKTFEEKFFKKPNLKAVKEKISKKRK